MLKLVIVVLFKMTFGALGPKDQVSKNISYELRKKPDATVTIYVPPHFFLEYNNGT